jgi:hypothetical protein
VFYYSESRFSLKGTVIFGDSHNIARIFERWVRERSERRAAGRKFLRFFFLSGFVVFFN